MTQSLEWPGAGVALGLPGFLEPADAKPCGLQFDEAMADDLMLDLVGLFAPPSAL